MNLNILKRSLAPIYLIIFALISVMPNRFARANPCEKQVQKRSNDSMASYIQNTSKSPPNALLVEALAMIKETGQSIETALDLGAGSGRDSMELLKQGIRTQAIDKHSVAIDFLEILKETFPERLLISRGSISEMDPIASDLVNAQNSLPFLTPENLLIAWTNIRQSLNDRGWFVGTFFGDKDDWSHIKRMNFFKRSEVENLLKDFDIIVIREIKRREETSGVIKNWHYFEVIAQKNRNLPNRN